MIGSSWDKQNGGQKSLDEDRNSVNKILIQRLHNKAKYQAQRKLLDQLSRSVQEKKNTQKPRGEKQKLELD